MPKKISFPRKTCEFDCDELGYPDVKLTLWDNPSRRVRLAIYGLIAQPIEELEKQSEAERKQTLKEFFWGVSELVMDCNVEGADFSTPEAAEATYDDFEPDFLPAVITQHMVKIVDRESEERKKLEQSSPPTASTPDEQVEPQKPSESES